MDAAGLLIEKRHGPGQRGRRARAARLSSPISTGEGRSNPDGDGPRPRPLARGGEANPRRKWKIVHGPSAGKRGLHLRRVLRPAISLWGIRLGRNTNGLILGYFPTGNNFVEISEERIRGEMEDKQNLRPR